MKDTAVQATGKAIKKTDVQKKGTFPQKFGPVVVSRPSLLLVLVALIVYLPTIKFGFTELDDSIFIKEFHAYNSDLANLATSFRRGLFDAVKDPYFRPLFLDSMIINNLFGGENIFAYHLVNILLHMASVALLFRVFVRLNLRKLDSFLLCLLFAVHPVLTQAVAWIPGRNDTLLAVFSFAFLASTMDFLNFSKVKDAVLSAVFLLLAFFTKETAVFLPLVAIVLAWGQLDHKPFGKNGLISIGISALCFAIWFGVRAQSPNIRSGASPAVGIMINDFVHRLPLVIQYLGKIFIPANLSVFPMQEDTTYIFGILAVLLLAALLFFSPRVNWKQVVTGFIVFFLLLVPALLVPNNLNEQTFEHRLYLPMMGILLVIPETALFKKLEDSNLFFYSAILCVLLAITNFVHQRNFTDPITFWTQAEETSPHSAYAKMMLGARLDNVEDSYKLFRAAYKLDPKQKYINYYYGRMLQMKDSVLASEPYLLKEKALTNFYDVDFYLARVAITKGDTMQAIAYLESFVEHNPVSEPANVNLLLMYISKKHYDAARKQADKMRKAGIKVPDELKRMMEAPEPAVPASTPAAADSAKTSVH